jgi:hypothetical protein
VGFLVAVTDFFVHLEQLRLVLPLERVVHLLQVVDDFVDPHGLQGELFEEYPEVNSLAASFFMAALQEVGNIEIVDQFAVDSLEADEELIETL